MTTTSVVEGKPPTAVIVAAPYAPAALIVSATSDSGPFNVAAGGQYGFIMNETGLGFQAGMRVRAAAQVDPNAWIEGVVQFYDVPTNGLMVLADLYNGTGTYTGWNIFIQGQPGKTGAKGDTGAIGPQGPPGGLTNPNVVLTGTPTAPTAGPADASQQIANTQWVRNTLIANYQPLDPDLTSLAAASGIAIYYRKAAGDWEPVIIGTNLTFDTGTGTLAAVLTGTAPINSPTFTGDPKAPTPAPGDNDTSIATTAWAQTELGAYAKKASPAFTGVPTAPTPAAADNSTTLATTAFVQGRLGNFQPLDSDLTSLAAFSASGVLIWRRGAGDWQPVVMGSNMGFDPSTGTLNSAGGGGPGGGIPEAPNDGTLYGRISLGWAHAVAPGDLAPYALLAGPVFSGVPRAPTAAAGATGDQLATLDFVVAAVAPKINAADVAANYAPLASPSFTGTANFGGTINVVGAATFTNITATGNVSLTGTFSTGNLASQRLQVASGGGNVQMFAVGTDTNIGMQWSTKGGYPHVFYSHGTASIHLIVGGTVGANQSINIQGGNNANPTMTASGGYFISTTTPPTADNSTALATTAFVQSAIASAGFTTGDVKLTLKTVADTGWIMMDDTTIGDGSSGAAHAGTGYQALYTLIWQSISNAWAPVQGGRGASAAADWAAHKWLALPKVLGRALAAAGSGAGLTARALGTILGEETHTQTAAELFSHAHGATLAMNAVTHQHPYPSNGTLPWYGSYFTVDGGTQQNVLLYGGYIPPGSDVTFNVTYTETGGVTVSAAGGGAPMNVMQPSSFLNVMVKL